MTTTNTDAASAPAQGSAASATPPSDGANAEAARALASDAGGVPLRLATRIAADAEAPVDTEAGPAVVRLRTAKGNLSVWSGDAGEKMSLVLAGYESKPGSLAAPAKVLRRTSGRVAALAAVDLGAESDSLFVAWASDLGATGQVIAVVHADLDLGRVSAPITLGIVNAGISDEGHVALARNPRGGVLVVHQGATGRCSLGEEPVDCLTYEVKAVSPNGTVNKLGGGKLHGGPSPEYFLVDLDGRALLVYASSMRGGRTIDARVVPYIVGDVPPPFDIPFCSGFAGYPPELLRGTRGEIVAICVAPRDAPPCAKPEREDPDRCPRLAVTGADGVAVTKKGSDVPALRVTCAGGKQRVIFSGGDVTLVSRSSVLADFAPTCAAPAP